MMVDDVTPRLIAEYLKSNARAVSISGAEPRFIPGGNSAFLLLHGWGASAESIRFLARGIADQGFAVLAPTLPGHGTSPEQMLTKGPLDWIDGAREALRLLSSHFEKVYLLGVSMGGALSLQVAALDSEAVSALITANAPVFLDDPDVALDLMSGPANEMMSFWPGPKFLGPPVSELTYSTHSRKSGLDLLTMAALAWEALPRVRAPLLVLQSVHDPIVPKPNADEIIARVGSSSKVREWLHHSLHLVQLDTDRDEVVRLAMDFVRNIKPE
jgi:carboxylesterase